MPQSIYRFESDGPVIQCEHPQLVLEHNAHVPEYLTGWYVCTECGERVVSADRVGFS